MPESDARSVPLTLTTTRVFYSFYYVVAVETSCVAEIMDNTLDNVVPILPIEDCVVLIELSCDRDNGRSYSSCRRHGCTG